MNLIKADSVTMAEVSATDYFVVKWSMPIMIGSKIIPPATPPTLAMANKIGKST